MCVSIRWKFGAPILGYVSNIEQRSIVTFDRSMHYWPFPKQKTTSQSQRLLEWTEWNGFPSLYRQNFHYVHISTLYGTLGVSRTCFLRIQYFGFWWWFLISWQNQFPNRRRAILNIDGRFWDLDLLLDMHRLFTHHCPSYGEEQERDMKSEQRQKEIGRDEQWRRWWVIEKE